MSLMSLARRYRPLRFGDLVGQESVAAALKGALSLERVPRAILLSGIRGIGKTTLARLYAKSLCCQGDYLLCPGCEACLGIEAGRWPDVQEIDGASHNGVEEVRALQEGFSYKPKGKYRIYIIDEVHMLSLSAFNALLKSLEEPPPHVIFVFATTELAKVPSTVLSRCQIFHLRPLKNKELMDRLGQVLSKEGISWEPEALFPLVRRAEGSLRDALTLLDQVVAAGSGCVDMAAVQAVVPVASGDLFLGFLGALLKKSSQEALGFLGKICETMESREGLGESLYVLRIGFLLMDQPSENWEKEGKSLGFSQAKELGALLLPFPRWNLHRLFRVFHQALGMCDGSLVDRYVWENVVLEWCWDPGLDTLLEGLSSQREKENDEEPSHPQALSPKETATFAGEEKTPVVEDLPQKWPLSWIQMLEIWKKYRPLQARQWQEASDKVYSPELLHLLIPPQMMGASALLAPQKQEEIRKDLQKLFGFDGKLVLAFASEGLGPSPLELENIKKLEQENLRKTQAQNHPWVQALQKQLPGSVDSISIL